jgi:VWFA-related protein
MLACHTREAPKNAVMLIKSTLRNGLEDGLTLKQAVHLTLSVSLLAVLFFLGAWAQQSPQTQSQQNQAQQNQGQPSPADQPQLQRPQTPQGQQPTFTSKVKVVEVPATVRDKHKQIVRNLTKDDFTLQEDGRPQVINYFSEDTNLPLTLGLLVDTSESQRRVLEDERHASFVFLQQMLHDKNMAFVIHFDHQVELLQDLTTDRNKLESALDSLQIGQRSDNSGDNSGGQGGSGPGGGGGGWGGHHRGGGGGGYHGGGTQLYDAIFLASDDLMKKQQGRKAIIVLSDGVDHGSKVSLDHAIETAQRADTMVYSILFKDEDHQYGGFGGFGGGMGRHGGGRYPQEQRPDGKKILERVSKETGGRLFEVSKKEPVDQIYNQIADELRYQYELGYTPDRADLTGYHKIQLATKKKDLEVQARDGYYADNPITASSSQVVH